MEAAKSNQPVVKTPVRTEHPHIVRAPGIAGGRPTIAGTRISVEFIVGLLRAGDEPWDIIASYPHLKPAAVFDAISYYLDHQEEIDREIEESTPEKLAERYGFVVDERGKVIFNRR
jgi:uncharacterized protein (DUF433 family)